MEQKYSKCTPSTVSYHLITEGSIEVYSIYVLDIVILGNYLDLDGDRRLIKQLLPLFQCICFSYPIQVLEGSSGDARPIVARCHRSFIVLIKTCLNRLCVPPPPFPLCSFNLTKPLFLPCVP